MKKLVLGMVALAAFGLPAAAAAQNSSTVNATAEIAQYSSVTGDQDMAFSVLDPTGANTASAVRELAYNYSLTVNIEALTALEWADDASVTLPISIACAHRDGTATWTTFACGTTADHAFDVTSAPRTTELQFTGTIAGTDVQSRPAGTYSGSFDVTITNPAS